MAIVCNWKWWIRVKTNIINKYLQLWWENDKFVCGSVDRLFFLLFTQNRLILYSKLKIVFNLNFNVHITILPILCAYVFSMKYFFLILIIIKLVIIITRAYTIGTSLKWTYYPEAFSENTVYQCDNTLLLSNKRPTKGLPSASCAIFFYSLNNSNGLCYCELILS